MNRQALLFRVCDTESRLKPIMSGMVANIMDFFGPANFRRGAGGRERTA